MIKKINFIKKFGVFDSYRRSGEIQDFSKVNIIYGWNYSGKTTISRIFQCFENKKFNVHYPEAEFELESYDGKKGNQANLSIENQEIRVFNSDFVRDNIHLEGESFDPILLLGEDTKAAEDQIKDFKEKLERINKIKSSLQNEISTNERLIQDGLTQTASFIKENLQIVQAYTRAHVKPLFDEIKSSNVNFIKSNIESIELIRKATSSENDKLADINELEFSLFLPTILEETTKLLNVVPEFSTIIQYFVDNPDIANWVETGLPIHKEKLNCEFCGNEITQSRLLEISAHFSEDLKKHKALIDDLKNKIRDLKLVSHSIQQSSFYKEYWDDFNRINEEVKKAIKNYNSQYDKLISLLELKKNKPFELITDISNIDSSIDLIATIINDFNELIKKNNSKTKQFEFEKKDAIDNLKKHYVAKFILEIQNDLKEQKIELYKSRLEKAEEQIRTISSEIKKLEATISKAHKGSEILNEYIEKFLGRNEIQVIVENQSNIDRFRLKRKDSNAVNLSEGEKTAIAFSFFLTKLLENNDLSKVVVYIDDPISSLDSNHIFQVNAILKDFFFRKENEDDIQPKLLNCCQLFLSTHNFEFFSLLRELPVPKGANTFYYFVKRLNSSESKLDKLPKSLQNYSSEYHYLFKLIKDFSNAIDKDLDEAMILPNTLRRFVELYTYSRIPGNKDQTVDVRAEQLWGTHEAKRILKVCHYFSHGNNIQRMSKHNEFICDIEIAVSDLIQLLQTHDSLHYNQLLKSTN